MEERILGRVVGDGRSVGGDPEQEEVAEGRVLKVCVGSLTMEALPSLRNNGVWLLLCTMPVHLPYALYRT